MVQLSLILVFLAIFTGEAIAELNWQNLTEETFTPEHNWEIVRAHIKDRTDFIKIISKGLLNPKDIKEEDVIFTLYTRDGDEKGVRVRANDTASLEKGNFDKTKITVFATHGFLSGATTDWMIDMKTAQLEALDCNFVTIDWSKCAGNILYPTAKGCTITVGGYLADLVKFLLQEGADVSKIHLMGHSLGAHLVAQVSQHGLFVERITGWDPAGVLYENNDLAARLDPSDAKIVDVIHTCRSELGYNGVLGHFDFFPNGGKNQPGCSINFMCDHSMSYYFYLQSLYYNYKYPSIWCDSFDSAISGKCTGETNYMGVLSVEGKPGSYYLEVKEAATGSP